MKFFKSLICQLLFQLDHHIFFLFINTAPGACAARLLCAAEGSVPPQPLGLYVLEVRSGRILFVISGYNLAIVIASNRLYQRCTYMLKIIIMASYCRKM